jgi:hypothetical protein
VRPPTSDRSRSLPLLVIQAVGVVLILAVFVAGVFVPSASVPIMLGCLGVGVTFASLGGTYEKARRELARTLKALAAEDPPDAESPGPS